MSSILYKLKNCYGPGLGPFSLASLTFFGAFSRGLVNFSMGLLAFWGILWLVFRRQWNFKPIAPFPQNWLIALLIFALVNILASLLGLNPLRSLLRTAVMAYLLLAFPLVWLALSQAPSLLSKLPILFSLSLIPCLFLVFQEAGCHLVCVRAKAGLGVIELGGLLGQLPPLLVGAWALAVKKKQKFLPWIYLTGLACALVAIRINCSRIALLSAPALSALIFLVNFKAFGLRTKIYAFILAIFAVGFLFSDTTVTGRVKEMFVAKGNLNNDMRLGLWHYGWEVFKKHPVLGVGPGAIERPNVKEVFSQEYESIISFPNQYLHVHQSFINALAESGVPGLVTFLAVLLIPLIYLRKNLFTSDAELFFWSWSALASFLQFIFNGLTDNLFTIKPLNYVFWTIIASALWLASNRRTDEATKALAAKKSKPFRLILG